jgi:hypothetical protein
MELSFVFWTQKFDWMMIFLLIFLDAYISFFFFEFFKGPFLWVFFNAIGISPLVMFLLEILWWLYHLSIFLLSLFFSLVDIFVSGQHIDLPLFPLAVGAKWKNLCIIFCFCLKFWTRPPRLGRSSRNFRSSLRYFG